MSLPLVTCLCLTTQGRVLFLKRAIDCFIASTYPARELLIIADSADDLGDEIGPSRGHLPNLVDDGLGPDVGGAFIVAPRKMNIGQKRNYGCNEAAGDLIAIWDDDDYSAPGRLSQQVFDLRSTNSAVTGYREMKFTDGASWWSFSLAAGFCHGTSLMFRRDWWAKHPFPELNIGEDAGFCEAAAAEKQLLAFPDLGLMYATIHPGNTSKRRPGYDAGWTPLPGFEWSDTSSHPNESVHERQS